MSDFDKKNYVTKFGINYQQNSVVFPNWLKPHQNEIELHSCLHIKLNFGGNKFPQQDKPLQGQTSFIIQFFTVLSTDKIRVVCLGCYISMVSSMKFSFNRTNAEISYHFRPSIEKSVNLGKF